MQGDLWIWLGLFGALFLLVGGFFNLVKVFEMQQGDRTVRLERLRGGAQELLGQQREGQVSLISDEHRRRRRDAAEEEAAKIPATAAALTGQSTPYKDVLVGHA